MDAAGTVEMDTNANNNRKEGILVQYTTDAPDTSNQEDTTCTITGNEIKNTRWSSIYAQTTSDGTNVGLIATITGNICYNSCLDVKTTDVTGAHSGINTNHFWQTTITGNIIRKVNTVNGDGSTNPTSAIQIRAVKDGSNVERSRAVVDGNTIHDAENNGIVIAGNGINSQRS